MSEFKSWSSYLTFSRKCRSESRYIFDQETQKFLDTVLITSANRHRSANKGTAFCRSQIGYVLRPIYQEEIHISDVPYPFPPERMKPLPEKAKEGRANPKGIPFLYLATDHETAMAESRPWLGAYISVGKFTLNKKIKLVDCTYSQASGFKFYFEEPDAEAKAESVWHEIGKAFSSPVTVSDDIADYIPTQIIAELFKNNGFDGIYYKSNLGKGHNFVLFDINAADLVGCSIYETKTIQFAFSATPEYYSV